MKAEILAVGTEILLGDIINTNAQFISKELASLGIDVYRQEVIGDNEDRLLEAIEEIFQRSDILICTGGLGPTEDDLTKETICKYFNADLELHEESLEELKNYYKRLDRPMTESNLKQVYFPKESKVLSNPNGTAPGMILEKNDKVAVILPGPPREMKPMFLNYVKAYLKDKGNGVIISEVLRVLGVGESTAANMIKDFINNGVNPTVAPYAKEDDVIFRITARGKSEEEGRKLIAPVKEEIKRVFNLDCYGEGEELTIEEVLGKLLVDRKLTISTAESCTGGMIASRLINYPGISEVFLEGAVTYSNEAKERTLNVKKKTLDTYGAVSEETAKEMAIGISKRTGSDISVVTTGIAGPGGGSEEKPVGLVYIGLYYKGNVKAFKYIFNGNRHNVRTKATVTALDLVRREILKDN
ncbi:competence/damage-inducible protein A [Clostridium paraputrificum]|uniref:competence/damage-inducible protein A n=1 Tax=Clostridium paraputrificum TaxID=29363 RepID=UPI000D88F637|nr:competence/damage-inducible protein A [Clostridium paraputrificum]RKI45396.1 competence/damage-inducible protein A [Clostridium paraputrificum]SQB90072.1 putative competence-damage inducible protein CinA [Clostridium paraputrificum]